MSIQADSLDGLPSEFDYIRQVTLKYTRSGRDPVDKWKEFIKNLSPDQLKEIAEVYLKIAAQGDPSRLSKWIAEVTPHVQAKWDEWIERSYQAEARGNPVPPEPQQDPRALRLFELFDFLAKENVQPFVNRRVTYIPPPINLDWTKLPSELAYLHQPAMKWGKYQFEEDRARLAQNFTSQDIQELNSIALRVRFTGDRVKIGSWLTEYRPHIHPEAALVYWLLAILDEFFPEESWEALEWRRKPSARSPDWAKLPLELRYLAQPAEIYGHFKTPDERLKLMLDIINREQASGDRSESQRLLQLAKRVQVEEEIARINDWLAAFPPSQYPESSLIHGLCILLEDFYGPRSGSIV